MSYEAEGTGSLVPEDAAATSAADPRASTAGDCFVAMSADCQFWDGQAWVPDWRAAVQFADPLDPFTPCERLVDELCHAGTPCSVAYVPRAKVAPAKLPRARPRRQRSQRKDYAGHPPPAPEVNLDVNDLRLGVDRLDHDPDGVHELADAGLADSPSLGSVE